MMKIIVACFLFIATMLQAAAAGYFIGHAASGIDAAVPFIVIFGTGSIITYYLGFRTAYNFLSRWNG